MKTPATVITTTPAPGPRRGVGPFPSSTFLRPRPAISRILRPGSPQAKLEIGAPGDRFEREADRVADQVMRMPDALVEAEEETEEEEGPLQARELPGETPAVPPGAESRIEGLGAGQALGDSSRAFFEPRFGQDFSGVRIHTGPEAEAAAASVRARAFTLGPSIVFGKDEYAPETAGGRELLAHELTHVVQQGGGGRTSGTTLRRQQKKFEPISQKKLAAISEHVKTVYETQLPYEIINRRENWLMSKKKEEALLVSRKVKAVSALGELRDERAVITLVAILNDRIYGVRRLKAAAKKEIKREAIEALGKIGGSTALKELGTRLGSQDEESRHTALGGLRHATGWEAVELLLDQLKIEQVDAVKSSLLSTLGEVGSSLKGSRRREKVVQALIQAMKKSPGKVAYNAIVALGKMKHKSATPALLDYVKAVGRSAALREAGMDALGKIGDKRAVPILIILFEKSGSKFVRRAAAKALGKIGGAKAEKSLKRRLSLERDKDVKAEIRKALEATRVKKIRIHQQQQIFR